MASNPDITVEQARSAFSYNKETGEIICADPNSPKYGQRVDQQSSPFGYRSVRFNRQSIRAHRLAFFLVNGRWPNDQIDHINRQPGDNRWENLREATPSENQLNRGPWWTKTSKTMNIVRVWMRLASPAEHKVLADAVGTSVAMLRQYAGGHRQTSAETAGKFEAATAVMHKASKGRLPKVMRTDLCEACRACPYASKVLGERAIVSEFPIIEAIKEE